MCGRYTLTLEPFQVKLFFGVDILDPSLWKPRYNIAPGQDVPILLRDEDGRTCVRLMRWGFVPSWSKDVKTGYKMINARSETADEKASFKRAFLKRRCAIVSDGFYEWRKEGNHKTPMWIHRRDQDPMAIAGLWECWHSPQGEVLESFTILTTSPNRLMESIHDRMPAILPKNLLHDWLDPGNHDPLKLKKLLKPFLDGELEAIPVSTVVNSPANDRPECIRPAPRD